MAKNSTTPRVTILPPSPKEICDHEKKDKTLVCLATGFYPDHVSVYWKVNGEERKDKVSTDPTAQQDQGTLLYHISSRIKVTGTDWKNPKNGFTCIVRFFDGENYQNITKTIRGKKDQVNPKMLKTIAFGYILFLAKSVLYALIVAGLMWKLKSSKQKKLFPED